VTDLVIQTISNHINLALGERCFDEVQAHRKALRYVFASAAPIDTFHETSQRIIVWTDVRAAATLLEKPQLPSCSPRIPIVQGSEVSRKCHRRALKTLIYLPRLGESDDNPLYQVFRELHSAAHGGLAHYVLARRLAEMTADALAPPAPFTPFQAVILAASITSWSFSHFAELPSDANISILHRLYIKLQPIVDLSSFWTDYRSTSKESLLWVLFTANATILAMEEWGILSRNKKEIQSWLPLARPWFKERLQQTLSEMDITEYSALKEVLKLFPYMSAFHTHFGRTIAYQCGLSATPEEMSTDLDNDGNDTTTETSVPTSPGSDVVDENVQRKGIAAELAPE